VQEQTYIGDFWENKEVGACGRNRASPFLPINGRMQHLV
jgi:hypothetical protein